MPEPMRKFIFSFYEQNRLRNWFYTVAFAIFVPTGFRFAILAWEYGDWFDKPLSVLAGMLIGATTVVTLFRIWSVPPVQTIQGCSGPPMSELPAPPTASEFHAAAMQQAARNREIARGAAALGSPHGWPFYH